MKLTTRGFQDTLASLLVILMFSFVYSPLCLPAWPYGTLSSLYTQK